MEVQHEAWTEMEAGKDDELGVGWEFIEKFFWHRRPLDLFGEKEISPYTLVVLWTKVSAACSTSYPRSTQHYLLKPRIRDKCGCLLHHVSTYQQDSSHDR